MAQLQQALTLYTELQDISSPMLSTTMNQLIQCMTTKDVVEEMVTIGIFNQIPTLSEVLPIQTLNLLEVLIINRSTAQSFITTNFYEYFLPFLLGLNESTTIITSLRVLSKITRYAQVNGSVVLTYLLPHITSAYLDSVVILFNIMSHNSEFEDMKLIEGAVGKLLSCTEKTDYITAVYAVSTVTAEEAIQHLDNLLSRLPQADNTSGFICMILSKILQTSFTSNSTKQHTEARNKILNLTVINTIANFILSTNDLLVDYANTFFLILSTDYRGINIIKKTIAPKQILTQLTIGHLSSKRQEIIYDILTNFATDFDMYQYLKRLNVFKFVLSLHQSNSILPALHRVLFAYYNDEFSTILHSHIDSLQPSIGVSCLHMISYHPHVNAASFLLQNVQTTNIPDYIFFSALRYTKSVFPPELLSERIACDELLFLALSHGYEVSQILHDFSTRKFQIPGNFFSNHNVTIDSLLAVINANSVTALDGLSFAASLLSSPHGSYFEVLNLAHKPIETLPVSFEIAKSVLEYFIMALDIAGDLISDLGWISDVIMACKDHASLQKDLLHFISLVLSSNKIGDTKDLVGEYVSGALETSDDVELCANILTELSSLNN
ncbi:Uncharacterized protein QTN25_003932 [Entamoeba marina]